MKPSFESVGSSGHTSFLVRQFEERSFSAPYHFHPEYELTWIVRGSGKRYVGAHMFDYLSGDLVLLGANLPHCWKTGPSPNEEHSISIVIQFRHDFMGPEFFDKPEMSLASHLLANSKSGIHFKGDTRPVRQKMLALLEEESALKKLILLLDILNELAAGSDYVLLDLQEPGSVLSAIEKERMNLITAYIVDNFQNQLSLKEAASIANMTYHAFCKYFKRANRMGFMEAVTKYRIDFAVRLLTSTDKSISQIAFESGFNDISNFHKTFRSQMRASPLYYRKQFKSLGHN